jgi:hypothetical protein
MDASCKSSKFQKTTKVKSLTSLMVNGTARIPFPVTSYHRKIQFKTKYPVQNFKRE